METTTASVLGSSRTQQLTHTGECCIGRVAFAASYTSIETPILVLMLLLQGPTLWGRARISPYEETGAGFDTLRPDIDCYRFHAERLPRCSCSTPARQAQRHAPGTPVLALSRAGQVCNFYSSLGACGHLQHVCVLGCMLRCGNAVAIKNRLVTNRTRGRYPQ